MSFKETFIVNGENLLKKIKEIIAEGNVTKISISDKSGKEIMSFPVTIGVVGVVFAPIFAAIGALAALLTECKITVEKRKDDDIPPPNEPPAEEPLQEGTIIEVK
ncbi:DUF4342 domain-containing protein [Sphingobacterium chuzhouense]|uniref:DUF4342 domain-containing protein n=1 Tax=Sphingobacterium chuzhouense TaxID=1742264 RepID=A0ABR7XSD2_9SPHI|nr:DUF4342 domain-containing protein [Sphingobacterium chuzhouense]MBD1421444.1 DUF4342 domain-containing protein [Sphingobacterium chuzhouense]